MYDVCIHPYMYVIVSAYFAYQAPFIVHTHTLGLYTMCSLIKVIQGFRHNPDTPLAGARARSKFHQGEIGTRARANVSSEHVESCAVRAATMPSSKETPGERATRLLMERE